MNQLFNIFANFTEMVCVRCGAEFLVAAVLITFLKEGKAALKFAGAGLAFLLFGLATPGMWNSLIWLLSGSSGLSSSTAGVLAFICGLVSLLSGAAALGLLYLPVYIAKRRGKPNFNWIIGLSAAGLLFPFVWAIAIFLAYKKGKAV
jgi:hypothetical protein